MHAGAMLVIGYGNDLRGDDAAGPRAADQVGAWSLPGVEVRTLHQLTPELADPLAAADRAIFLDAHPAPIGADVRIQRLHPAAPTARLAHTCDPQRLLALAQTAFGRWPEAWWITIPATDFAFGAPLSALAQRGIADALVTVRLLLAPSSHRHRRIMGCPTR